MATATTSTSAGRPRLAVRLIGLTVVAVMIMVAPAARVNATPGSQRMPSRYLVADTPGVLPEGIGLGRHGEFFVTSSGTGAVYRGSLRAPEMRLFAAGSKARSSALGVHVAASGLVFVAGSTALDVYSPTGRLLARRTAPAGAAGPVSLNDLVITDDAVFVTDFANPRVLRASVRGDQVGPLLPWLDVSSVDLGLPAPYWFLNGIVAADRGRTLLVSSQGLGRLLRVDVTTGAVAPVDLDVTSFAADGLQLQGRLLFAVLNYQPPSGQGVYVAVMDRDLRSGRVVAAATDPDLGLDSPTTLAVAGHRILVVNSQLDHPPGEPPYTVSALRLRDLRPADVIRR